MSVVQHKSGGVEWAAAFTLTLDAPTAEGATLVLATSNGRPDPAVITDDGGNDWTLLGSTHDAGAASQRAGRVYVCQDANPVTQVTTAVPGLNAKHTMIVAEVTPTSGTPRIAVGTTAAPGTVTTTDGGNALVFGFCFSSGTQYGVAPAGWTRLDYAFATGGSAIEGAWDDTDAGSTTPTFGAEDFGLAAVAFDAPAPPGPPLFLRRVAGAWAGAPVLARRAGAWIEQARRIPARLGWRDGGPFLPDVWATPLPADAPLDPRSEQKIAALVEDAKTPYGSASGDPAFALSPSIVVVTLKPDDTTVPVTLRDHDTYSGTAWGQGLQAQFEGLRIPVGTTQPGGADSDLFMTVYDPEGDVWWDLWHVVYDLNAANPGWTAERGIKITDASQKHGVGIVEPGGFIYAPLGSGLTQAGMVRTHEMERGEVNHRLALSIPVDMVSSVVSTPAIITDGTVDEGVRPDVIREGQIIRLPAGLDLDSLNLRPEGLILARALQEYGGYVVDRTGSASVPGSGDINMRAENTVASALTCASYEVLWGGDGYSALPWDQLELVEPDYIDIP